MRQKIPSARTSVRHIFTGDGGEQLGATHTCGSCGATLSVSAKAPPPASRMPRHRRGAFAAAHTPIAALMTRDVVCVRDDVSLESLTELLLDKGLHGGPVIDAHGALVGFVAMTDLVRFQHLRGDTDELTRTGGDLAEGFHAEELASATVRDVMMPIAYTLGESASITMAAALMALEGVHRIPVVSGAGEVVGILSALDVMRWLAQEDGYLAPDAVARRAGMA